MEFALANLNTTDGERVAIALPSGYFRLDRLKADGFAGSLRAILTRWAEAYPDMIEQAQRCAELGTSSPAYVSLAEAELTTTIRYPNKLICVGGVYKDHLRRIQSAC
jgi:hypothetical protein